MLNNKPLLIFPCEFAIKVMGVNSINLIEQVRETISFYTHDFSDKNMTMRPSRNNNYLAITATVNAISQQHLDQIYLALNNNDLVKFTL